MPSIEVVVDTVIILTLFATPAIVWVVDKGQFKRRSIYGVLIYLVLLAIQLLLALNAFAFGHKQFEPAAHYGFAIGIGVLLGATEMMSRYRDDPFAPLVSPTGALYILINGAAAALAYYLMGPLNVSLAEPVKTFTAGLGAMAFFRSGLFTARVGSVDIPVGPNLILQVILKALDRAYDRQRATPRSQAVSEIMRGVVFDNVKSALPTLCLDLMQNVSAEETAALNTQVNELTNATMPNEAKSLSLGLALINIVGEETLRAAVEALVPDVDAPISGQTLLDFGAIDPELAERALPDICAQLAKANDAPKVVVPGAAKAAPAPDFKIDMPDLSAESRALLSLRKLVAYYGEPRVAVAIGILAVGKPADETSS
jgi:hypothetical protein